MIEKAFRGSAPAQINIPRDYWTQVIDIELPQIVASSIRAAARRPIAEAAKLLSEAKVPGDPERCRRGSGRDPGFGGLAERLDAPVCCNYQHNDAFPGLAPALSCGPLGYNGSKAAMEMIAKADVVLALGTRLNPFSTLPAYQHRLLAEGRQAHPGRHQRRPHRPHQEGRVGIQGDAKLVAEQILAQLSPTAGDAGRDERKGLIAQAKSAWAQELSRWITRTTIPASPGTSARATASRIA